MTELEPKDTNETLDYMVDLTTELKGRNVNGTDDTISSVVWSVPAGLTQGAAGNSTTKAWVFLSGGTLGERYTVSAQITTAGGRIYNSSFTILIADK